MAASPAWPGADDLGELRQEMRRLRQGQERLEKELGECKALLLRLTQQAPGQAAPSPVRAEISLERAVVAGRPDAPLVMVEFCDLQCPHSIRYHRETFPLIKRDYIDTGKLLYALVDYPLPSHAQARKAAEALHCAPPGEAAALLERLTAAPNLAPDRLVEAAALAGLDPGAFTRCLEEGRHAQDVERNYQAARAAGVTGTPSFLLGANPGPGKKVSGTILKGAAAYAHFQAQLENLLRAASR